MSLASPSICFFSTKIETGTQPEFNALSITFGLSAIKSPLFGSYICKSCTSDKRAYISNSGAFKSVITNDNGTYYRVSTDWVKTTLAPGKSKTVIVTIECIKSAIDHQVTNFGIKFTAEAELHA